jgi:hypothetical protein
MTQQMGKIVQILADECSLMCLTDDGKVYQRRNMQEEIDGDKEHYMSVTTWCEIEPRVEIKCYRGDMPF